MPLLLDDGERSYLYGPLTTPIAQIDHSTGDIEYLHTDLLGSVRGITDDSGDVVSTSAFSDYGTPTGHAGTSDSEFGFTGAWTDPDTALIYLRARDYDPVSMQFLRVDPAIDSTRQPYAYANNAPTQLTDPTGLDVWSDLGQAAMSGLATMATDTLAMGAGFLDDTTGGMSSLLLGAVIPGYDCFVQENSAAFEAGRVASTVVSIAMLLIPGVGLAAAAIKTGLKYGLKAVTKLAATAIRNQAKAAAASVRSAASAVRRGVVESGSAIRSRIRTLNLADDSGSTTFFNFGRNGGGPPARHAEGAGPSGARSYVDLTSGGSIRNVGTNTTHSEFSESLSAGGWGSTMSKDGAVQVFQKDGAKYVLRSRAGSYSGWSADFTPAGAQGVAMKIRLGYEP